MPPLDGPLRLGALRALPAGMGDENRVAACVEASSDYFLKSEGRLCPAEWASDHVGEALADPTRRLFVLEDPEGAPGGLLELALDQPFPGDAALVLLVLARGLRGSGLGGTVVQALFEHLASAGFTHVRLGVRRREKQAARFWTAQGMWEAGSEPGVRLFEVALAATPPRRAGGLG